MSDSLIKQIKELEKTSFCDKESAEILEKAVASIECLTQLHKEETKEREQLRAEMRYIEQNISELRLDNIKSSLDLIHPQNGDYVILYFDCRWLDHSSMLAIFDNVKSLLPDGATLIALPRQTDIQVCGRDTLISIKKSIEAILNEETETE